MTQDKAHPTPPAVPSEWKAFEAWAHEHLGQGYSLAMDDGVYLHPVTRWAFKAYKAGRAAPVARNTTAEPAPIQPAGVEVERDAARYRWLRDQADPDEGHPHVTVHEQNDWGKWHNTWTTGETLDAAIDQALAAASQGDRGKT